MSSNIPINNHPDLTAPTPQNTPLTHAPIAAGLSRPTVPDITEDPAAEALSDNDAEDIQAAFQSGAMQSALAGIVQDRLSSLIGKSSGYIEALPVEVKRTVAALHGVQVKQNELQNQFKREFWELERKVSRHFG
jgi:nucleosome assembly protein 1-like 1